MLRARVLLGGTEDAIRLVGSTGTGSHVPLLASPSVPPQSIKSKSFHVA